MRYAQDAPFWGTRVSVESSEAEIRGFLRRKLGADEIIVAWSEQKGRLLVHFLFGERPYQILYYPLPVPSGYRGDSEKPMRQMMRRALNHLKVVVDLVQDGHSEALMPYDNALTAGVTLQEVGPEKFRTMLQDANDGLLAIGNALPARSDAQDADFTEVNE